MTKKKKVLVAMSGGVDSSVAAYLLLQDGYDVTGAYMKQWSDSKDVSGVCTWKEDRRDALRVAAHLGIPLITLDFEKEYKAFVMEYMFAEYEAGRTPNPDVMCNKFIKFGAWLEEARNRGYDFMATGHYAQTKEGELLQAKDIEKDQTYFLHQLSNTQLKHTLFPVGSYTKEAVRDIAQKAGLPTAQRKESMGICFVGEVPMKVFLQQRIKKTPGDILLSTGEKVGEHEGLSFYTIGQRHIGALDTHIVKQEDTKPLYVVEKKAETNTLILGYEDDPALSRKKFAVSDVNWINRQGPEDPFDCLVRLRHRQPLQRATVTQTSEGLLVVCEESQRAVTPGQFAVFYTRTTCLGGGIIA